ncbi:sulfatase-like hydrolase/transferase [Flavivirga eckloniae]|uniref:Heparan N-sulfatase n=1 Tax=Flavivirga eckloniae TaxID=1803846 RepID=A0A2K9PKA1_9FLAO|nr:sulfatase-like hydrolase/transferase [Flavivirga eckloniae]AUP77489.1 heparan N-sulfatase [Flavivirga eckloniae]
MFCIKNLSVVRGAITFLSLVLLVSCQDKKEKPETLQPNIVLIIADDVSWNDIGPYGHKTIKTPNLDALANDGMLFNQAFLTASSCSPSRTSIISGLYPHNTDAEQLSWPLPDYIKTFVQELKNSGYWTGLAGKHNMGDHVKDDFDVFLEMQWKDAPIGIDRRLVGDGSGCDEWVKLLKQRPKDKPFFTWLAAADAHRPYYENTIENQHTFEDVEIPPYMPNTEATKKDFALYYDEVSRMDNYIGQVIKELETQGVSENTMVLFISDNGRAFPRDKITLYDGGIKTPWIAKWPGKIKAGSVNNNLVSSVDIAPTFMSIAGLKPLDGFEGYNFLPMLKDTSVEIRNDIYAEDHFHDFEDYTRAVRTKQYKYIKNYYPELPNTPSADIIRDLTWKSMVEEKNKGTLNEAQMRCFEIPRPEEELYDVIKDPYELNNLAGIDQYKDVLLNMRSRLEEIRNVTKDHLPAVKLHDDFFRDTGLPTKYRIRPRPSKADYLKAQSEGIVLMNPDFKEEVSK